MYRWRKLTPDQQEALLATRKACNRPWHSPVHIDNGLDDYLLSSACYEHACHIGYSSERMSFVEAELLAIVERFNARVHAWVVLPNHYHLVVRTDKLPAMLTAIGQFHGRTSFFWNGEEGCRGRKVWCNCAETHMKSQGHLLATVNYVHHNPVKHCYAKRWQDWPYSSAREFLESAGEAEARRLWKTYPVDNYGNGWDDADL